MRLITRLLTAGSLLALCGCGDVAKNLGLGPLPDYSESVQKIEESNPLSDADKAQLAKWAAENKETFKKVQARALGYKTIVETHNKWAKDKNLERLNAMGFKKEDLQRLIDSPAASALSSKGETESISK